MDLTGRKCLIAYFSRKGENYAGGGMVHLKEGNTAVVAAGLQKLTSGDLFEIATVHPYPEGYAETTKIAAEELHQNARPELTAKVKNLEEYEVVFLGYPNWWGTMPMGVWTFLESGDFSGKIIFPFCTNEGSGLGNSVDDLRKLCPDAEIADGLALRGSDVRNSGRKIAAWVQKA